MAKVHYEYMPCEKDCGYCMYANMSDSKGIKIYCREHRGYYPINDNCRKQRYVERDSRDIEKFLRWHVSTMMGQVLNMDLDSKPFTSIRILKDYASQDENLKKYVKLYDSYGEWIATGLFYDLDRTKIATSLMPILYKVSDLIDKNMMNEAFNEYSKLVMLLYNRYVHTLNYNSPSQNKVKIK